MARRWLAPPRLRTHEKGELSRTTTWLELFFDLVFVAAVAALAHELSEHLSLAGFVRFVILFVPVWWAWVGATFYVDRFASDDIVHRVVTFLQMAAAGALAVNVHSGLGETSAGFALAYAAFRLLLVVQYAFAWRAIPDARPLTARFGIGFGLAAVIWLISVAVSPPWRFLLWLVGLVVDLGTPFLAGQLHSRLAPHQQHLPERFGLFTIIVLGESLVGIVAGITLQEWTAAGAVVALLGFAVSFGLWWLYFENLDGTVIAASREAGRTGAYAAWLYSHLPLVIGLTAFAVGLGALVLVPVGLTAPTAVRWVTSGSFALALFALAILSLTTTFEEQRLNRLQATYRMTGVLIALAVAVFGTGIGPIALAGGLAALCVAEIVADAWVGPTPAPALGEEDAALDAGG